MITPVWNGREGFVSVVAHGSAESGAKSTTYIFNCYEKPTSLVLKQASSKTGYRTGEHFDPKGMKLVATFGDGKTEEIPLEKCSFSINGESL